MKALGILAYLKKNDYIMDLLDKNEVIEAIEELEALQLTVATLEAHIAEFQKPKNCSGCRYHIDMDCTHWSAQQEDCCNRYPNLFDYYEPKEQQ